MNPAECKKSEDSPAVKSPRTKNIAAKAGKKKISESKRLSSESHKQSEEAALQVDRNHTEDHLIRGQKNLGVPLVVVVPADDLFNPCLPEVFMHKHNTAPKPQPFEKSSIYKHTIVSKKRVSIQPDDRSGSPCKKNSQTTSQISERMSEICSEDSMANLTLLNNTERSTLTKKAWDENAPRFYCLGNKVIAVMQETTRFCFTGKIIVEVIYGAVEVYGWILTTNDRPTEIYSPKIHSSLAIETNRRYSEHYATEKVWDALCAEGINRNAENRLVNDIKKLQPGMAVIVLMNIENNFTKFLNVYCPFQIFPKISDSHFSWTDSSRAEMILQSNLYYGDSSCKDLRLDPLIVLDVPKKMLNCWRAGESSCTMVAGGKSVGKSTTVRGMINTLLPESQRVVLVDLDPGQSECTPAGCISYSLIEEPLLGPNFVHLRAPVHQIYIGDVNIANCTMNYINAMRILMEKLSSCPTLSRLPIIVNTMGYTYGLGWDIIIFTLKLIRPSLVVQIMSDNVKNNFPNSLSKAVVNEQKSTRLKGCGQLVCSKQPCNHELLVVRSQAIRKNLPRNEAWNMEPYQLRELAMVSYLSRIVQYPDNSTPFDSTVSLSLSHAVPYKVPFSSLSISIPNGCVPPSHALNVINGNIVALCGINLQHAPNTSHTMPRVLTRLPLCTCYGFGIVRGVDMAQGELFLITPLDATTMAYVNCLSGCIPIPSALLENKQNTSAPYTGGKEVLPTSRDPRRGYFRMRYQNN